MSPLLVTSDCRQSPLEKRHNPLLAINIQWKSQEKSDSIQAWRGQGLLSTVIIKIEIRRQVSVPRLWYFYRHRPLFENFCASRRADSWEDKWCHCPLWQNQWKKVTTIVLTSPLTWTSAILWKLAPCRKSIGTTSSWECQLAAMKWSDVLTQLLWDLLLSRLLWLCCCLDVSAD